MKILSSEIKLREETRSTEQAKLQMKEDDFAEVAIDLAVTQQELTDRTDSVISKIEELPDANKFQKEIAQLTNAADAMADAESILQSPDTGSKAIAAETEAIEWLLRAKRAGKNGGGGGGSTPSGGSRSGADTGASALALLGDAKEKKANVIDRETIQATGKSGRELPEEFRVGLDRYFEALEGNDIQQ